MGFLDRMFGSKYSPYIKDDYEAGRDIAIRMIKSVKENKPLALYSPEDNIRHARNIVEMIENGDARDPQLQQYIWVCSKVVQHPENKNINGVLDWCKELVRSNPENFTHCSIDGYDF